MLQSQRIVVLLLLLSVNIFDWAKASSQCWQGVFSFTRCCLAFGQYSDCWDGPYTYQACCLSHPVLSSADLQSLSNNDHWTCKCDTRMPISSDRWDWCAVRKAMMLNWDIRQLYQQFLMLDTATLAECPLGALQFMVAGLVSKVTLGASRSSLQSLPTYVWTEELVSRLLHSSNTSSVLQRWVDSGWNTFFMLSHLWDRLKGGDGPSCTPDEGADFLSNAWIMIRGGASVPVPVAASFLASLEGGVCSVKVSLQPQPCCIARALGAIALADSAATRGHQDEYLQFLLMAESSLQAGLGVNGSPGSLALLLLSRWPVVEAMDKLFQVAFITLKVQDTIQHFLKRELKDPFNIDHQSTQTFRMRIFPHREIVSDMVRFSKLPFCGMRPFLQLVERISVGNSKSCSSCGLDFVEGGPHIGDCTLWATAALEYAGLQPFAVAYEPLPDASTLFRESVITNRWDGRIVVVPKALAAKDGSSVRLAYFPGHNGEGTTVRASEHSHCGEHCAGFSDIPTVTLDNSWPALRPAAVEVLKLSVNGEELNTMRGSRSLLSKRQVCSVLMHVAKAKRGWDGLQFSTELWDLLHDVGGMTVSLFLDEDVTSQVHNDSRPRPSTRHLYSASELDAVLGRESTPHDYIVSRLEGDAKDAHCKHSLALQHWDEVFVVE